MTRLLALWMLLGFSCLCCDIEVPSTLSPKPDIPSIEGGMPDDKNPTQSTGGDSGTTPDGGNTGSGGSSSTGGTSSMGGLGGDGFGGQGGSRF